MTFSLITIMTVLVVSCQALSSSGMNKASVRDRVSSLVVVSKVEQYENETRVKSSTWKNVMVKHL